MLMLFLICLCVLLENPIHILDRPFYDLVDPLRVLLVTVLLKLLPDLGDLSSLKTTLVRLTITLILFTIYHLL